MPKCGICGKEVPEQPKVTEDGRCSACKMQLRRYWDLPKEQSWGKLSGRM